jgi:hypothetical protein
VLQTPCLSAPADDRTALATTAGGIVLAACICTLKPILAATPARSISLPRPATVNGAPLSETKVKAALVTAAPAIHPRYPRAVGEGTICHELRMVSTDRRNTLS